MKSICRKTGAVLHNGRLAAILLYLLAIPRGLLGRGPADSGQQNRPDQVAQPITAQPSSAVSGDQGTSKSQKGKPTLQYNKDRILFVAPNYQTVENPNQPFVTMTTRQKFYLASCVSFDPFAFPEAGLLAVAGRKKTREWGNSASGLAERYAAAFADETISTFMRKAVVPSVLRQDPRYFRLGQGNLFKRTGCAFSRTLVEKNDTGNWTFASSNLIGMALGATISNVYYPAQERSISSTLSRFGTQFAVNCLDNWVREYWPDVRRRVFHR